MMKFDPKNDLTLTEVTQVLREMMQFVPDEQIVQIAEQGGSTLVAHMKEQLVIQDNTIESSRFGLRIEE